MTTREIETKIATALVERLLAEGYSIRVHDGGGWASSVCVDKEPVLDAMFSTDGDTLYLYNNGAGKPAGWILLIYGNGVDVISDFSFGRGIDRIVDALAPLCDELSQKIQQ